LSKIVTRIVIGLSLIILLGVMAMSARDVLRYPGSDLRPKIVGARLLLAHLNAYPNPETPEPNPYYRMFNENTFSPVLLLFYAPLCWLPFGSQRLIYFAFEWFCVGYMFVQTRQWCAPPKRTLHCAFFALFVVADFALRLHMERGQYYLLIAALTVMAVSAWLREEKDHGWIGPLALGILLLIRPTFLILIPVLWLLRFHQQAKRALLVAAVGVALTVATFGIQPWTGYFHMVSSLQRGYVRAIFMPEAHPVPSVEYQKVEGQDFSRQLGSSYFVSRASIGFVVGHPALIVRLCKTPAVFSRINTILLIITGFYCLGIAWLLRNSMVDMRLGFAFLTPIMVESFGPQRFAYADVTLAPVLLLIVAIALRQKTWGRYRVLLAAVIAVCVISSVTPLVMYPVGKLITGLSLARWSVLLFGANAFFVKAALRSQPGGIRQMAASA